MVKFVNLDESTGRFFVTSKTEQEGYEKHVTSKGKESFRFYFPRGIFGEFKGLRKKEVEYNGNKFVVLEVYMEYGGDIFSIQLPWGSSKTGFSDYTLNFLFALGNMKVGTPYRIYGFKLSKDQVKEYQERKGNPSKTGKYSESRIIRVVELEDLDSFSEKGKVELTYYFTDLPKMEFLEDEFQRYVPKSESLIQRSTFINKKFEEDSKGMEFVYNLQYSSSNPMVVPSVSQPSKEEEVEI